MSQPVEKRAEQLVGEEAPTFVAAYVRGRQGEGAAAI